MSIAPVAYYMLSCRYMALETDKKQKIIKKYALGKNDTGSPEIQVALLSERISELSEHLKEHRKDNHSRTGLIKMVGKRRRLLEYLKSTEPERYDSLMKALKL